MANNKKAEPCVMMRKSTLEVINDLERDDKALVLSYFIEAVVTDDFDGVRQRVKAEHRLMVGYYNMLANFQQECAENYKNKCQKNKENIVKRYNGIQSYTTENDGIHKDKDKSKYKSKDKEKTKLNESNARTQEIIAEYQAVEHTAWHESLAMTYRLERADVLQCIEDGVHYCVNMGIDLTRSNIMRYTKTACERYKPALKPLQDRKTAFASECKQLKADANLIGEFYEYYTQPMRDNDDCMLFESFRSWNTATRFKQFLNRKQHGN